MSCLLKVEIIPWLPNERNIAALKIKCVTDVDLKLFEWAILEIADIGMRVAGEVGCALCSYWHD